MATGETVVVKLVVAADGALQKLDQFDKGMTAAANASVKAGAGIDAFNSQIARQRAAIEAGLPVLNARVEVFDREARVVQNAYARIDPLTKARTTAERELGKVVAASSNLVAAGKMSEGEAIRAVTAIEAAHVAQINKVIEAQSGLAKAVQFTTAQLSEMATAERLAATSADGQAFFNSLSGISDAVGKSARDAASVFSAEMDRMDEIASQKASQIAATFAADLDDRLIAGAAKSARDAAAVFSAELDRIDEIATLKAQQAGQNFSNALNASFGIGIQGKVARESAAVFEEAAREAEAYGSRVSALKSQINPLIAIQDRLNAELAEYAEMAQRGDISTLEWLKAQDMVKAKLTAATMAVEAQRNAVDHYAKSASGATFQTSNIAAQFQDIAVSAQMGMNPMMIALQQGTQLAAVFNTMERPLEALPAAFLSIVNPVSLITIGLTALAAVGAQWAFGLFTNSQKATDALKDHKEWLDKILTGYDAAGKAATKAADDAAKLPKESVVSNLGSDQTAKVNAYAAALDKVRKFRAEAAEEEIKYLANLDEDVSGQLKQAKALDALRDSARVANPDLDALHASLTELANSHPDDAVERTTRKLLEQVEAARLAKAQLLGTSAALDEVTKQRNPIEALPGVADAIAKVKENTVDLRTEKQKLDEQFRSDAMGARTTTELYALVAAYANMESAAKAAAWAVANSGDAAEVAAGQYGTAQGAANAYANALWNLGNAIPNIAAAQAATLKLKDANDNFSKGLAANKEAVAKGDISIDEYARRQTALNDTYAKAKQAISGVTSVQEDLDKLTKDNAIGALTGRAQALARVNQQYEDQAKKIKDTLSTGAAQADVDRLLTQNNTQLASALKNTNAEYDRQAAKKGAKAGQKEENSYAKIILSMQQKIADSKLEQQSIGMTADAVLKLKNEQDALQQADSKGIKLTADKRAELLRYADQLTATQIETKKLQAAEKEMQDLWSAIGATISSMFDGSVKSFDDFIKHMLDGLAKIGQSNLSKLFSADGFDALFKNGGDAGQTGSAFTGGWGSDAFAKTMKGAVKDGTKAGWLDGLKNIPGGASSALSAGLGGLGIGYQSQSPVMGGIGGALSGAAAGIAGGPAGMLVGALIGGLGGVIGGFLGMNEALEKAKKELKDNKDAIDQFIATGLGEHISQYASAVAQFNAQGAKLLDLAKAAGDSQLAENIQASIDAFKSTLGGQFADDLKRSLNNLRGQGFLNDIADAQEKYNQRLKDAAYLGIEATGATEELNLSIQKIAKDASLTTTQILILAAQFPSLAGALDGLIGLTGGATLDDLKQNVDKAKQDLRDAYQKEADALQQAIDKNKQFIASLKQFKDSLTQGASSPLSPHDKLIDAQNQFAAISQAAMNGDQDALGKLQDISQQYLEDARAYYATSDQYLNIFNQVNGVLDQVLGKAQQQVSADQLQLDALNTQVGALIDINTSVMSVVDAIKALQGALSALDAGPTTGTTTPASQVDTLYQSVLGRSADATGAAYWQGRITDAGGLTPDITKAFIAAAIGNGETVDPTLRAAYGLQNGGIVGNGVWGRDSVLANYAYGGKIALAGGEFVMPSMQTSMYRPQLEAMRRGWGGAGNDNSALVAEVRALRGELAAATASSGSMVAQAVAKNTESVERQTTEMSRLRRAG